MRLRFPLAALLAAALTLGAVAPASAAKRRPDLRPAAVAGVPAAGQLAGGQFPISLRVRNLGRATARSSLTGLYLSRDGRRNRGDRRLARANTGKIRRRRTSRRRVTAKLPATVTPGVYRLLVCADIRRKVRERRERNNCRASRTRLTIVAPPAPPPLPPPPAPPAPPAPPPSPPTLALHLSDNHDYGYAHNTAREEVDDGDIVTLSLRMGAGIPGAAGYERTDVADEPFIGGAESVLAFDEDDDSQNTVALPFSVPFAGVGYGEVSVSTNGWASFGDPAIDYWNDYQPDDFRGLEFQVGEYSRGVMPFWLDGDLQAEGTRPAGQVKVVNPGDGQRLALQWDINSHEDRDEAPRRKMQALLFGDGRVRYDYDDPATSTFPPDDAFVGLSPGTGADVLDVIAKETRSTPGTSYLYTPKPVSNTPAPAGTVEVTLPYGSSFANADDACTLVTAPTDRSDGLVRCTTPALAAGESVVRQVRFVMPSLGPGTTQPANVASSATWRAADQELTDEEELVPAGGYRDVTGNIDIAYAGPAGQGAGDPLEFTVQGSFSQIAREPVVTIEIPAGLELTATTLPGCSDAPSGFGGGEIECVLASGTQSFNKTVTFEAQSNGSYTVGSELVADNADADTDSEPVTVPTPP